MNFPYDYRAFTMMQVYLQAGDYQRAKPHLEILADEVADHLAFFESIDPAVLQNSFPNEYGLNMQMMDQLLRIAEQEEDSDFLQRLESLFGPYQASLPENFREFN